MADFDQRNQQVTSQVNVAGNAYFGTGPGGTPLPAESLSAGTGRPVALQGRLSRSLPQRNIFFTGRDDELARLHTALHTGNAALTPVPQALQGLGGIGKTQTAAEYAYRYREEYEGIFWVVGETPEQLASQLAALAGDLEPPVPVLPDQNATLAAVKRWFATHSGWLLIVDNAENLPALKNVLPPLANGRLLLTTRDRAMGGLAQRVEIERLNEAKGALLLMRRAGKITLEQPLEAAETAWQTGAKAISQEVDGLPLALDQAAAYIETREITPEQYLAFYQKRRQELHKDYDNPDHASVAVTFSLALEQVEQIPEYGKAAAQLARLCAFLAPEPIPDEIFTKGAPYLEEPLSQFAADEIEWAEVCAVACRYALTERLINPHRLQMHSPKLSQVL